MKKYIGIIIIVFLSAVQSAHADNTRQDAKLSAEHLGQATFQVSCTPVAQAMFNQAIAMLHSFWYSEAEKTFRRVAALDTDCAMSHWGIAMSVYYQLWATPMTPHALQTGRDALQQAQRTSVKTERERAYLDAIGIIYQDDETIDYNTRKRAYEQAMAQLWQDYPTDSEAAIFYALALISTASPTDKTYANQKQALALLQDIREKQPNHPGIVHYIIHSSDYPELAPHGLDAARQYAQIAPAVPHALHMPSHIFIRLGQWHEAAQSNLAAYQTVKRYTRENPPTHVTDQQIHAMDYLIYAYLQTGQTGKAEAVLREALAIEKMLPENTTSAYALAAIPARYAVETNNWHDAATLSAYPADFPWVAFGWCEAVTHFARGLGSARTGNIDQARESLQHLETLRDNDRAENKGYSADQIEIQRLAVAAWVALAENNPTEAEELMRASAMLEDSTEKDNVTPGAIKPARELLGELLLALQQPENALTEFEAALHRTPNRRNGIDGALQAARLIGDEQKTKYFQRQLQNLAIAKSTDD